jgi:hypothetical protein
MKYNYFRIGARNGVTALYTSYFLIIQAKKFFPVFYDLLLVLGRIFISCNIYYNYF